MGGTGRRAWNRRARGGGRAAVRGVRVWKMQMRCWQWPEVSDFVARCANKKNTEMRESHFRGVFLTLATCKRCDTNGIPRATA